MKEVWKEIWEGVDKKMFFLALTALSIIAFLFICFMGYLAQAPISTPKTIEANFTQ